MPMMWPPNPAALLALSPWTRMLRVSRPTSARSSTVFPAMVCSSP